MTSFSFQECSKQCFLPLQRWVPSSATASSLTDHGFPALSSHLEYLAPRSSTLVLYSTGTPQPKSGGGVPPFLSPVLDHGAESSPPLAGMDWRMEEEYPLRVSYPSNCVSSRVMSSGSRYILPLNASPCAIYVVHPTPPHPTKHPRTTSGERDISSADGARACPLTDPLRQFAAILGHFQRNLPPLLAWWATPTFAFPQCVMRPSNHLRGT